jgi:hypothetical protein
MVTKRIITVICCLALITCAFGLSSCSGSGSSTGSPVLDALLYGTWRSTTITVYTYLFIFTSAALYSVTMDGQSIEAGIWTASNGNLTMTPDGGGDAWNRDYTVSGDDLTISTTVNGETYTDYYVRQTD